MNLGDIKILKDVQRGDSSYYSKRG